MLKVDGKEGLIKDPQTNTVVNVNRNEYERYKSARKRNLELVETVKKQESEIKELKEGFSRLEKAIENISRGSIEAENFFRTY